MPEDFDLIQQETEAEKYEREIKDKYRALFGSGIGVEVLADILALCHFGSTLDPDNKVASSDRGIAKLESGQYLSAKVDFSDSIRRRDGEDSFLWNLYEYRGDANVKLGYYTEAIADYSKAIERHLANDTFLLSLKQIRALYPEYDAVPDET